MRTSLLLAVFPVCALTFAACGGDDDAFVAGSGGSPASGGASGGKGGASGGSSGSGGTTAGKGGGGGTAGRGGAGGSAGAQAGRGGAVGTGGNGSGGEAGSAAGADGGTGAAAGDTGSSGEGGSSGIVGSAPVATINHPGDGEMRAVNASIPFIGVGTDAEDGALTGSALVWTSSLEGQIGTGEMFNKSLTQAGLQVITLTVTDSDGNQGTDSVTLDMQ